MKYNKSKSNKTKYKKANKSNKSRKSRKNKTHKRKNIRKGGFGWFGPAVASSAVLSQNKPGSQQRSITNTNSWAPKVASSGWRGPPRLPPNAIPHVSFAENPRKPEKPENSINSWKTYEQLTPEEQEQEFRENASGMADFDNPLTKLRTLEGYRDRAATLEEARKKYEMSPYTVGYIDSSNT
jgi:hypothetical protein